MIDNRSEVNGTAYMDFKKATDGLFERISHEDLADALGGSPLLQKRIGNRLPIGTMRSLDSQKGVFGITVN